MPFVVVGCLVIVTTLTFFSLDSGKISYFLSHCLKFSLDSNSMYTKNFLAKVNRPDDYF
jgi:hypothetical protein